MVVSRELRVETQGHSQVLNLTEQVMDAVQGAGIAVGLVCVFVPGSTASVSTIEFEPALVQDMRDALQRLAPEGARYRHDGTWGEANGYAHVRATLMGPSITVPVAQGRPALGTWQQIVLIDHDDRPRSRTVIVQVVGE